MFIQKIQTSFFTSNHSLNKYGYEMKAVLHVSIKYQDKTICNLQVSDIKNTCIGKNLVLTFTDPQKMKIGWGCHLVVVGPYLYLSVPVLGLKDPLSCSYTHVTNQHELALLFKYLELDQIKKGELS